MALHPYLSQIRQLIAEDELPSALQQLHDLLEDSPKLNEVIHQTGRFTDIQKHMRLGTLSFEQGSVSRNQISIALLDLLDEITRQGQHQTIKAEIEKHHLAIQHSKNVVSGSTINARDVHIGDTHIHYGDKKIPRHLGSLVSKPGLLLGREDDLHNIHQQLQSGQHFLFLVNGMGGMGKTTLAAEYYCRYLPQYTHLAWVFAETGITEALLTLNNKLKVDFPPAMPNSERVMLLMDALRELEGPALLVIDNANDLNELKKHDKILRACPNFRVLLTSRITEFEQASTYPISPLEKEKAALQIFKTHYAAFEAQEIPLFYEIYDAVQGNTLVLEVLAKNLQQHNNKLKKRYQLAELKLDLEKGLSYLSQSKEVDVEYQAKGTGLRHEKPAVILLAMYDLSELNREESQLLSNFAVLPAEYLTYVLLENLLPDRLELDQLLISLAQKGWLDKNMEGDAFRVNPVVQEVVRVKNEELLEDCRALIHSLNEKLEYQPGIGHLLNASYAEAATYAILGESVISAPLASDFDVAILCERLGSYHSVLGNLPQALTFFEQYNILCKECYIAYPQNLEFKNGLAISYSKLGETYRALGNLQQALSFFEKYNELEKKLYIDFPQNVAFKNLLAISYQYLGITLSALGDLQQALSFFEKYNELEKELYSDFPQNVSFKNSLAISCQHLGITHSDLGNLPQTLSFFEQFNELAKELYADFPQNISFKNGLAVSYEKLGDTHSNLDNLQQALSFFEKSNELEKELYSDFPQNVSFKNGLAISYGKLGETQRALGNVQQALTFFEQFNELEKELYSDFPQNVSFKNGLAISYEKLGHTQRTLDNLQQALIFFEQYNTLCEELYAAHPQNVSFKNTLAISYAKFGEFYRDHQKDPVKARGYLQQCYHLLRELSETYPDYVEFKNNFAWAKEALREE